MNRVTLMTLMTMALLGLGVVIPAGDAIAQQKQKVSYKVSAENTKYLQRHYIDVGDVSGHQVWVTEIQRTFPNNAPMINGVRLKEVWTRGFGEWTDYNGPGAGYSEYVLENGDKFFVRYTNVGQSTAGGKRATTSVATITSGTGKFIGIQGSIRSTGTSDPKAGINETQGEIEYWFAK